MPKIIVPVIPNSPTLLPSVDENMAAVLLCENKKLGFVENRLFDPSKLIYDTNYQNSQAHSAAFRQHMRYMAELVAKDYDKGAKIVEVGCGKGDFLKLLFDLGFKNISGFDASYEGDWNVIQKRYLTQKDSPMDTDLIILRHTLEHIQNPCGFLDMLATIYSQQGDILIEVPCFDWIKDNQAFFDITYEHVNYFNLQSLTGLFNGRYKKKGHVFGDQYIFTIANLSNLSPEFRKNYDNKDNWINLEFGALFPGLVAQMTNLSNDVADGNAYIWGAATKGCLFLNHARHANRGFFDKFKAAIDINPGKTGKYLPGTGLPTISAEQYRLQARDSDVILVANPNYFDEICLDVRRINSKARCIKL